MNHDLLLLIGWIASTIALAYFADSTGERIAAYVKRLRGNRRV